LTTRLLAAFEFKKAKSTAAWSMSARFVQSGKRASRPVRSWPGPAAWGNSEVAAGAVGVEGRGVPGVGVGASSVSASPSASAAASTSCPVLSEESSPPSSDPLRTGAPPVFSTLNFSSSSSSFLTSSFSSFFSSPSLLPSFSLLSPLLLPSFPFPFPFPSRPKTLPGTNSFRSITSS
jgi:hypothetical protein